MYPPFAPTNRAQTAGATGSWTGLALAVGAGFMWFVLWKSEPGPPLGSV